MANPQSGAWTARQVRGRHFETCVHERSGNCSGAPVILALHGFTGGGLDFAVCAAHDCGDWHWICPDLPGHASCTVRQPQTQISIENWLDDFSEWVDRVSPRPSTLLGYSMGGRMALHAALHRPDQFPSAIVIGAHPGLSEPSARAERCATDENRAASLCVRGLDDFLKSWQAQPLIATQERIPEPWRSEMQRVRHSHDAEALADALIAFSPARIPIEPSAWTPFPVPLHYIVGEEDPRYRRLGERLLAEGFCTSAHTIACAGHAAHMENPGGFCKLLRSLVQ